VTLFRLTGAHSWPSTQAEHVSGAGAENGAERARKSNERERDLKKYGGAGAER